MPRRPATNSPDFPIASRRIPPPEVRPPLPSSSDHSGVPNRALFTVAEALQVLGVSRQTLYRALHEDRLCAHKIRGKTVFKRASLAMTVTEEAKGAAEEKRDQAQADLDAIRTRLNIWRKKLADTSLAPATLEIYMRSVTSAKREEANLEAAVASAEADVARTAAALADRPATIAAANEARRQALTALAGVKGSAAVNVQPWQRLYAELAKPPVILSGISSGEGVIFNIRDAREGREARRTTPVSNRSGC